MMEQDHQQLPETTNTVEDLWDTQFLEAISAAMDAVEEEENMWDAPLPSLEALEAAMEFPRCAITKRKKTDTLYSNIAPREAYIRI